MTDETKTIKTQEKEEMQFEEERTRDRRCFVPRADIYETDDAIHIELDMPGVRENSVEISLEKNVLTINGLVEPVEEEGLPLTYSEYSVGDFQRSFTIQAMVDVDGIDASLKNGVLHIRLPKDDTSRTKKIDVRSG